jgi:hypothetical protein
MFNFQLLIEILVTSILILICYDSIENGIESRYNIFCAHLIILVYFYQHVLVFFMPL